MKLPRARPVRERSAQPRGDSSAALQSRARGNSTLVQQGGCLARRPASARQRCCVPHALRAVTRPVSVLDGFAPPWHELKRTQAPAQSCRATTARAAGARKAAAKLWRRPRPGERSKAQPRAAQSLSAPRWASHGAAGQHRSRRGGCSALGLRLTHSPRSMGARQLPPRLRTHTAHAVEDHQEIKEPERVREKVSGGTGANASRRPLAT